MVCIFFNVYKNKENSKFLFLLFDSVHDRCGIV